MLLGRPPFAALASRRLFSLYFPSSSSIYRLRFSSSVLRLTLYREGVGTGRPSRLAPFIWGPFGLAGRRVARADDGHSVTARRAPGWLAVQTITLARVFNAAPCGRVIETRPARAARGWKLRVYFWDGTRHPVHEFSMTRREVGSSFTVRLPAPRCWKLPAFPQVDEVIRTVAPSEPPKIPLVRIPVRGMPIRAFASVATGLARIPKTSYLSCGNRSF